jgi:hypothetical protein
MKCPCGRDGHGQAESRTLTPRNQRGKHGQTARIINNLALARLDGGLAERDSHARCRARQEVTIPSIVHKTRGNR